MKILDRRYDPGIKRPLVELQPGDLFQDLFQDADSVLMKLTAQGPDLDTEWGVYLETGEVAKFDSRNMVIPLDGYLVVEGVVQ